MNCPLHDVPITDGVCNICDLRPEDYAWVNRQEAPEEAALAQIMIDALRTDRVDSLAVLAGYTPAHLNIALDLVCAEDQFRACDGTIIVAALLRLAGQRIVDLTREKDAA